MWLYARRNKGLFGNKQPYISKKPYLGYVKSLDIISRNYYDFMIYKRKLTLNEQLRFGLVFIGTIFDE